MCSYTYFSVPFSSSGIAVRSRMWTSKGYTKEVSPVVATPPSVTILVPPQQMESVGSGSEREVEDGEEGERGERGADTPRQLTSVSFLSKM